jgi:parallel beta-helix repeat protein
MAGFALLSQTGDILEISGGTSGRTYSELLDISGKNGGASYYTIKGSTTSGHNGTVTIDHTGTNAFNIWIHGSSYIKVESVTVNTIGLGPNYPNATGNNAAVYIYGSNYIQVNGCTFTGTSNDSEGYDPNSEWGCISAMGPVGYQKYIEIKNNIISAHFDIGIDLNSDGATEDKFNLVEGNTVTGFDYAGIKLRKNRQSIVRNNYVSGPWRNETNDTKIFLFRKSDYNYVYNNVGEFTHHASINPPLYQHYIELRGLTGCLDVDQHSSNNFFVNNTFSYTSGNAPKEAIHFADGSKNNVFQNNIFQGSFINFMGCWDASCDRSGQIIRNNIITGTITNWNEIGCSGTKYTQVNNSPNASTNWVGIGSKPFPYYSTTQSKDGSSLGANGFYPPTTDYSGAQRNAIPAIGAFEEPKISPPKNLRIVQ